MGNREESYLGAFYNREMLGYQKLLLAKCGMTLAGNQA